MEKQLKKKQPKRKVLNNIQTVESAQATHNLWVAFLFSKMSGMLVIVASQRELD